MGKQIKRVFVLCSAILSVCYFGLFIADFLSACPTLPMIDVKNAPAISIGPTIILVSYFEASKKGDAKTAANLIDYDEWAKDMNLQGDAKKQWTEMHRESLQEEYDMHKREGSTKDHKILSSEIKADEAVFKVSQDRSGGSYVWEVRLIRKHEGQVRHGKWRIKGFYLDKIEGARGGIIIRN